MNSLTADQFHQIEPLVRRSEIRSHLPLARAVLEGHHRGGVYVDDLEEPATALVCPSSGFFFVFGTPDPERIVGFLPEALARHPVRKRNLVATTSAWRDALLPLLEDRLPRTGFEFRPEKMAGWKAPQLPEGITLEALDRRHVERWGDFDGWLFEIFGGPEHFLARGFASVAVHEGRPVSLAAACAIGGGEAEIELQTHPDYRGRGLATEVARALVRQCLERDITPAWSCATANTASIAVALKAGFEPIEDVMLFRLPAVLKAQ